MMHAVTLGLGRCQEEVVFTVYVRLACIFPPWSMGLCIESMRESDVAQVRTLVIRSAMVVVISSWKGSQVSVDCNGIKLGGSSDRIFGFSLKGEIGLQSPCGSELCE